MEITPYDANELQSAPYTTQPPHQGQNIVVLCQPNMRAPGSHLAMNLSANIYQHLLRIWEIMDLTIAYVNGL